MDKTLIEKKVTYTLNYDGKLYVFEQVPAKVCPETGEQFFAPATVEQLHTMVKQSKPVRTITTPVFEFLESNHQRIIE